MTRQATRPGPAASARAALSLVWLALAAACGGGSDPPPGGEPIDREVFIEAYVELRLAALQAGDFLVPPEQREEILARQGVDSDMLLRFADYHGRDVDFMNAVWSEIEQRMEERAPSDDSM